ncbi:MAG: CheY-like receiver [Rhodospirillales bacterium]|nr:CheY-like receiver [Rhodospirillales bacterium]
MQVLLVDDDADHLAFMAALLRRAGHHPHSFSDAKTALDRIAEGATVDAVVTDVFMPLMDGVEFTRAIRRYHPDLPIIAVTGGFAGISHPYERAMAVFGARQVFRKPVDATELLRAIEHPPIEEPGPRAKAAGKTN